MPAFVYEMKTITVLNIIFVMEPTIVYDYVGLYFFDYDLFNNLSSLTTSLNESICLTYEDENYQNQRH